jgi:ketosteroid isomerase-like protein
MKRELTLAALAALALGTTACGGPKPVSEAQAAMIADETQTALASRNIAAVEARYSKAVIGFDPTDPKMSTSFENWDRLQKAFVAMQFDKLSMADRRIQVLDGDTFVVSGIATFTNSLAPASAMTVRMTQVYQRQDNGNFVIVTEHVSPQPEAQQTETQQPATK